MFSDWAPALVVSVMVLAGAVTIVLRGPFGRALAERLAARAGPRAMADAEQLGATVADLTQRLADVEERLDFAERLLAKQREAERLAPPR